MSVKFKQEHQVRTRKKKKKRKLSKFFKYFLISSAVALLLVLAAFLYIYTDSPESCRLCHELKPAVVSHERSLHARVPCYSCHSDGTFLAKVGAKLALLRDVVAHFQNSYQKPLNSDGDLWKEIPDQRCERCHPITREFTPSRGVLIDHKAHRDNGVQCTTCHNRVAHEIDVTAQIIVKEKIASRVPYTDHLTMDNCMKCHTGEENQPTNDCKACHPEQFVLPYNCSACHEEDIKQITPREHFEPDFLEKGHGAEARNNFEYCYQCHTSDSCTDCHNENRVRVSIPEQHEAQFHKPKSHFERDFMPAMHGDLAREKGKEYCFQCHSEKFCNDCHNGLEMPHAETFIQEHGRIVNESGFKQKCQSCHHSKAQFCESGCHHRGWNPALGPLERSHPQVVAVNGVEYCLTCHTSIFCAVCHVTGEKKEMFRD